MVLYAERQSRRQACIGLRSFGQVLHYQARQLRW